MTSKRQKRDEEESVEQRSSEYCRVGENASQYMHGLADAFEAIGGDATKAVVHHLRCHASELNFGTLWVEHGYRDPCMKSGNQQQ